jgi:formylglycine-generating enzyme required for sulfatase activity
VDALSDILLDPNTRTPLTMGLFGSWGSGKTSLMTMLRHRVARSDTATASPTHRTVWFNAWKYNQEDALWRALLLVLLDDLEQALRTDPPPKVEGEPDPEQLVEVLRQALYRETTWTEKGTLKPDWMQALTAGAGLAFNLILSGATLGLAGEVVDEARKTLGKGEPVRKMAKLAQAFKREEIVHTQAQLRSLEQFQENFAALVKLLLHRAGRRLVVFVDDLDRCTPEKAIQVLEAIKLFLDVPGCIFVLGLDDEAIETAVRARYKGEVKAREYLEKIIQLPFLLPPIEDEAMLAYVESLAPALPDKRCVQVFAQGLRPNPRQVKRTLNIYLLLMRLVEKRETLKGSTTPVRLAKIVAIQHGHPDLYALLCLRPGYLPELERYFRAPEMGTPDGKERLAGEQPALPEALQAFGGRDDLRRLLCLFDEDDARFDALTPLDVRSYITLTRRSTPQAEVPAVIVARLSFEPEMVTVPAGPFLMGTSEEQAAALKKQYDWAKEFDFSDEHPQHTVTLSAFEIGKYPVSNAEYAEFVKASAHRAPPHWRNGILPEEQADHPVIYVSWLDAMAYVNWLSECTSRPYRLPTEAEWEKAARGTEGYLWPWGDNWDPLRYKIFMDNPGGTKPVGQYALLDESPYGCADMAVNVWELCSSLYRPYPYRSDDGRENLEVGGKRVLRGGSWGRRNAVYLRCASRGKFGSDDKYVNVGFRAARGSL